VILKTYEIIIKPLSAFSTPLKGDTFFGQFCWQLIYSRSFKNEDFDEAVKKYKEMPFIVFSSAFPAVKENNSFTRFIPKPEYTWFKSLSAKSRYESINENKKLKKKKWLKIADLNKAELSVKNLCSDKDIINDSENLLSQPDLISEDTRTRNKINRISFTTSGNGFDPYVSKVNYFYKDLYLSIICVADTDIISPDIIQESVKNIGITGFGKDASIGLGRYDFVSIKELKFQKPDKNHLILTLSPFVPEKKKFEKIYFKPFTRFGKHGDILAAGTNPFKRPVIMADECSIIIPFENKFPKFNYLGKGITGASFTQPNTIVQGYSPWMPIRTGV
jgi:CRISPR-associated protein Csm4